MSFILQVLRIQILRLNIITVLLMTGFSMEKTLFLVSILGGSIGTWAGMYLFRHKTKHWYFVVGMPLILVLQLAVAVSIYLH